MTQSIEEDFKHGMRRLAGAVHLITTSDGKTKQGLTATAVCSLTAAPPTLVACVNKSASAHDALLDNRVFAVNVLAQNQMHLAQLFADNSAIDKRFSRGDWTTRVTGAPILSGSLCNFDCRLIESVDRSTHTLLIGEAVDVSHADISKPLMYFDGGYTTVMSG